MPGGDERVVCVDRHTVTHLFKVLAGGGPFIPAVAMANPLMQIRNLCLATVDHTPILLPRGIAETHEKLKHIISYTIVNCNGWCLIYNRAPSGGEQRLFGNKSIGVGGHLTVSDLVETEEGKGYTLKPQETTFIEFAKRELDEELGHGPGSLNFIGLLSDDSNAVGQVHLGLVFEFRTREGVAARENCLANLQFQQFESIHEDRHTTGAEFESWSKILIEHMSMSQHTFFNEK